MGLLPNEEEGDGRGWEPVMRWTPIEASAACTPTRRVGGVLALEDDAANSKEIIDGD